MPGRCMFNTRWIHDPKYQEWIAKVDTHHGMCRLCYKTIDVTSMGEAALTSHGKGAKHQKLLANQREENRSKVTVTSIFTKTSGSKSTAPTTAHEPHDALSTSSSDSARSPPRAQSAPAPFASNADTFKAELRWVLRQVTAHNSYTSSEDAGELFRMMFPDSEIACSFQCGEEKASYLSVFGLAPHFKDLLTSRVKEQDHYVLLLGESLNSKTHHKQMDVYVRLWHGGRILSRYLGSQFMGHGSSEITLEKFLLGLGDLPLRNLVQISADLPNVSWKFHRLLQAEIKKNFDKPLLDLGSCGPQIVHGTFSHGMIASDWHVGEVLTSMYWLFKDTPARREDYMEASGKSDPKWPLKFCQTGWTENAPVAERALEVWPDMQKYVDAVQKKKVPHPQTKSYEAVKEACNDPLLPAKLAFVISVAKEITPFLTSYQTDKSMLPFLSSDLFRMIKSLMSRYMKAEEMKKVTSWQKLANVDLAGETKLSHLKQVDLGFCTEEKLKGTKNISEGGALEFRLACRDFLQATVGKVLEKWPIQCSLAGTMDCLDPKKMAAENTKLCTTKMKLLLKILLESKRVNESDCEDIVRQYELFLEHEAKSSSFKNFDYSSHRVDTLLQETMGTSPAYRNVWKTVEMLLLLSHGQATVDGGFSTNRQVETDNLSEDSHVAQRIICDHAASVGGYKNIELTKALLLSASSARHRYLAYRDDKKKARKNLTMRQKRNALVPEGDQIKCKKRCLEDYIKTLTESADTCAENAATSRSSTTITKSNNRRRSTSEEC